MEWRDEGIIIGGRRHGETSLVLEVMTRDHGRHPGLVKGGRSKRVLPLLQPGNTVEVTWRARLEEHLGFYAIETTRMRGAELMCRPASLHGLNVLLSHLRLLAEREPHPTLYERACRLLSLLDEPAHAAIDLARFELTLLADSGFGLDLDSCAATGTRDDLIYVSPRSGRAVCESAGKPYKDRLLALPPFLRGHDESEVSLSDLAAGFRLTGYFLDRDVLTPRGLAMSQARDAFIAHQLDRSLGQHPPRLSGSDHFNAAID